MSSTLFFYVLILSLFYVILNKAIGAVDSFFYEER